MLMVGLPASLRKRAERSRIVARKDSDLLHDILAASPFCHLAYVIDGLPLMTPALSWQEDGHVYLIASLGKRAMKSFAKGLHIQMTVSVNGRAAVTDATGSQVRGCSAAALSGRAFAVAGNKLKLLDSFLEQLFSTQWERAPRPSAQEVKAMSILRLDLNDSTAKVRISRQRDTDAPWPREVGRALRAIRVGHMPRKAFKPDSESLFIR